MSRSSILKAAMLAVAGAAMSAEAQVVLFNTRPNVPCTFNGAAGSNLGLSSGNLSATLPQRWSANPFTLASNSTITQILVAGFVPAGFEFSNLAWKIWARPAGNPPPTTLVASGAVPYVVGVDDPAVPGAETWLHTINLVPGVALAAGDYYLTVHAQDGLATTGFANFAWMVNAQRDTAICPPSLPVFMSDANGSHGYRSEMFPTPGFLIYRPANIAINPNGASAWGPVVQDPNYLWGNAFTIIGTGSPAVGACCFSDGSCQANISAVACCTATGTYQGDGSACGNCPQPGACCLEDGSCQVMLSTACADALGIFRGANKPCSPDAACFKFGHNEGSNDAGSLPATAQPINGFGQPLTVIRGEIQLEDIDMYEFRICDEAQFRASTVGAGNTLDSILCIFNLNGTGVVMSDDTAAYPNEVPPIAAAAAASTITSQFINANGRYYLAMTTYNNTAPAGPPVGHGILPYSGANLIWIDHNAAPQGEWQPDGPGAAGAVDNWGVIDHDVLGTYTIRLRGACFLGCYANCDGSTGTPQLTANDFQCFLDSFAGAANGKGYANCDRSTGNPALTANDFQCFLNSFASGCP